MPREPLAVVNDARSADRLKDEWAKNCFLEQLPSGMRATMRPGIDLDTATPGSVGQGIFNYSSSKVRIVSDILYVGASSYAL